MKSSLLFIFLLSNYVYEPMTLFKGFDIERCINGLNNLFVRKNMPVFNSTNVEFSSVINGYDGSKYYYFDIDGQNGFLLFDESGTLILFDTESDISFIKENKTVYYRDYDFYTFDGESIYRLNSFDGVVFYANGQPVSISSYSDYIIEYDELSSYLSNNYSMTNNWYVYSYGKLDGLPTSASSDGYGGYYESVYITTIDGNTYGEGNCGIVSISNVLSYYSHYQSFSLLPNYSSTVYVTPSASEADYMNLVSYYGYHPKHYSVPIHQIYSCARSKAIENGYVCTWMDDYITSLSFVGAAAEYGYEATFEASNNDNSFFSISNIKNEIDNDCPLQLRVSGDLAYGNHGMMVTGYKYFKADEWAQLGHHTTIHIEYFLPFLSVFDGWSSTERWFDLTFLSSLGSTYNRSSAQSVAQLHLEDNIS